MPDLPNDVRLKVPGPDLIVEALQIMDAPGEIPMTAPTPQDAHHIRTTLLSAMEKKKSVQTNNVVLDEMSLSALIPLVYLLNILMRDNLVSADDENVTTEVIVRSDRLPVGAGLGSSAAFGVASAAALWQLSQYSTTSNGESNDKPTKEDLNVINQLALYSETLVHGTPSGLDNTVSTFGGAVCYTKDILHQTVTLEPLWSPSSSSKEEEQLLHILLTNTHVPRSTKKLVSHVRSQLAQHPTVVGPILDAMGAISRYVFFRLSV
jgi:mevalonate kinase